MAAKTDRPAAQQHRATRRRANESAGSQRAPEEQPGQARAAHVSLDTLRTLLVFYEEQGVTAAARRLGVSQPVVSRKLDALTQPEACGTRLLRRTDDGLRLTDEAQASLPAIRRLVRQYDQLLGYWDARSSASMTVSLGVGQFAAEHYVPRAVASLLEQMPDCEVTTRVLRGGERILGVWDGRFDLAVASHAPEQIAGLLELERGPRARLEVQPLAAPPLVVMAGKATPEGRELAGLPAARPVPLRRLTQWELVGLDSTSGVRRQLEERLRELDPLTPLTFVAEGGGWTAARGFARHGLGVAIVPLLALRRGDQREFTIRRLAKDFRLSEFVVYRGELTDTQQTVLRALQASAHRTVREATALWKSLRS